MEYNDRQTPFDKLLLENAPEEIRIQYDDFTNNVPFINWMLGERPRAKDLPRDEYGRIIVNVTKPHILEDMDYFRPTAIHYQKTGKLCDFKPMAIQTAITALGFARRPGGASRVMSGKVTESGLQVIIISFELLSYTALKARQGQEGKPCR